MSDERVLEVARAIRPYLTELLGPNAEQVDGELAALLARSRGDDDDEVEGLILDCLMRNRATHDWAARFLMERGPDQAAGAERGYSPLAGQGEPVRAPRFVCPKGDYVWYRHSVGQDPPTCPTHRLALQPSPLDP